MVPQLFSVLHLGLHHLRLVLSCVIICRPPTGVLLQMRGRNASLVGAGLAKACLEGVKAAGSTYINQVKQAETHNIDC